MAKGRKKQARRKTPRTAAKGVGAPASDTLPASEAVIEATADDAASGKGNRSPFADTRTPTAKPGDKTGDKAGKASESKDSSGPRRRGFPALLLWTAAGMILVAAVYSGSVLVRELAGARQAAEENTALSQRVDALNERLSQLEGEGRPQQIADATARIGKLEQDLSVLGGKVDEAATLVAEAGPGTSAANAELLARIDRMERMIDEIRLQLEAPQPGQDQPEGEPAAEAAPGQSGESDPWWSFLGRMLKISRVDGE